MAVSSYAGALFFRTRVLCWMPSAGRRGVFQLGAAKPEIPWLSETTFKD